MGKWRLRIGFASSDFASCIIWQVISLYIVYFYTDIMGLDSADCAAMFLLTKLVDAAAALLVGCLIDKTHTRLGKSRPWILGGCIPLGIAFVMAFSVPDFSPAGKLTYAYVTYTLLSVAYTVCNLPLSSLLSSLSSDPKERTALATMRLIGCTISSTLVSAFTLTLVERFGRGDEAKGFHILSIIFAASAILVFVFCVCNTRELPGLSEGKKKKDENTAKIILRLIRWRPFYTTSLMQFFVFTSYHVCTAALTYYFLYVAGSPFLAALAATLMMVIQLAGNLLAPLVTGYLTKRDGFLLSSAVNTAALILIFAGGIHVPVLVTGICLYGISQGLRQTLFYAIPPDAIDYCSLVLKRDVSGTFSALCGFLVKLAGAVSTSTVSLLLAWGAYDASLDVQKESAVLAITIAFIGLPLILNLLGCMVMMFYNVDKSYAQVRSLLEIQQKVMQENRAEKIEDTVIYAPVSGAVVSGREIPDAVLASGAVGCGIGIDPSEGTIVSPVTGIVKMITMTGHAVIVTGESGLEILIHAGINTVRLNGEGFVPAVCAGQRVEVGTTLLTMDLERIKAAGYSPETAVLVMNLPDKNKMEIVCPGTVSTKAQMIKISCRS